MSRAKDIKSLYDREYAKAANFRALHQRTADLVYPRSDQITRVSSPGVEKGQRIHDPTAVMASLEMMSGLSQNLIAPGNRFFSLRASDRKVNSKEKVKRYLSFVTDITHEQLFSSNFLLQYNSTLRALGVFGTGNIFSEYTTFLNFKDIDIGSYLIIENSKGRVDTVMEKFSYTARQASQEWGDKAGKSVLEEMKDEKNLNKDFEFIHLVRPREKWNPRYKTSDNMPIESVYVSVKDDVIVSEGGYNEFPYHVARWIKAPNEVWGRGQGTFGLPYIQQLQTMERAFKECANKHNNPALEVLSTFPPPVRTGPGALNWVEELGSIRAIQQQALGNFVVTKEALEMQQELVRKIFFNDIFVQLANLKGDRRTTVEIRERIGEGLQRLGPPIGRIQEEQLSPLIERAVFLLIRNGIIPEPPRELSGQNFEIEYVGRLALELKSHQARGAQQWILSIAEMNELFPEAADIVNVDSATRRLGETFGVNIDDMRSEEEVAEIRQARAEQQAAQRQLEMASAMADGYKNAKDAPEEGSPASQLMGV